jgi:dihydropteroate synthase
MLVTAAEEHRRLAPVLEQLAADGIPVSADSFRPETQRLAISAGVAFLNDIYGFGDPALAASECRLIVMHATQAAGAHAGGQQPFLNADNEHYVK